MHQTYAAPSESLDSSSLCAPSFPCFRITTCRHLDFGLLFFLLENCAFPHAFWFDYHMSRLVAYYHLAYCTHNTQVRLPAELPLMHPINAILSVYRLLPTQAIPCTLHYKLISQIGSGKRRSPQGGCSNLGSCLIHLKPPHSEMPEAEQYPEISPHRTSNIITIFMHSCISHACHTWVSILHCLTKFWPTETHTLNKQRKYMSAIALPSSYPSISTCTVERSPSRLPSFWPWHKPFQTPG